MGREAGFESRVVLVTGASRGLGRAIARGFGLAGYRVAANYQAGTADAMDSIRAIEQAGGIAHPYQADVRDAAAVAAMVADIVQRWGRLDVLVCNAAVTEDALTIRVAEEVWERVVGTILTGTFHCLRSAGAVMLHQRAGTILLVGSLAGLQGRPGQAPYAAAKAGLLGLMYSAAREWGSAQVRVNMVLPGWHPTALTGFREDSSAAPFAPVLEHGTTMEQVAGLMVALAAMPDVSGQVFNLDSRMAPR